MSVAEDLTVAKEQATVEETEHGVKRPAEDTSEVHSANDWEHADLGDGERKQKFLRLMGAEKTEHTGKIVIGDREAREERSGQKRAGLGFQEGEEEKEGDKPDQSGDSNGKAEVTETESAEAEKKEEQAKATEDTENKANGEANTNPEPVAEDSVSSTDKDEAAATAEST